MHLPNHIAFIMDGNGRWAEGRGMSRAEGHKKGVDTLKKVVDAVLELKIPVMTIFAFSTENWKRPKEEVDKLFDLIREFFSSQRKYVLKNDIKLCVMGDISQMPADIQQIIDEITQKTQHNNAMVLNVAINYGGQQEIVNAVNKALKSGVQGISKEDFEKLLYSYPLVNPDLIIRTSGEYRLSNFMMYQAAYAELYFTDVLWPDFNKKHLQKAIEFFSIRNRRFGGTGQ